VAGSASGVEYHLAGQARSERFVERFNRTYREEVLDAYLFDSLEQVREITESWIPEYNEERPHDSLGCVPPLTFSRGKHQESLLQNCVIDREAFRLLLGLIVSVRPWPMVESPQGSPQ
jgi:hypothetical protein